MRTLLAAIATICALTLAQVAQAAPTPQPAATYPAWIGAQYPYAQHYELMALHFDQAVAAAAEVAAEHATRARVRDLAHGVLAERTREVEQLRRLYHTRFGAEPPAWPGPGAGYGRGYGYGPGAMGGGYGPGAGGGGYGPGMVGGAYGPGMMGGYGPGATGHPYGPGYGLGMMRIGDTYQVMMGWNPATASAGDVDRGFLLRLMQSDAMEIATASASLNIGDRQAQERARSTIAARTQELQRVYGVYDAEYPPGS